MSRTDTAVRVISASPGPGIRRADRVPVRGGRARRPRRPTCRGGRERPAWRLARPGLAGRHALLRRASPGGVPAGLALFAARGATGPGARRRALGDGRRPVRRGVGAGPASLGRGAPRPRPRAHLGRPGERLRRGLARQQSRAWTWTRSGCSPARGAGRSRAGSPSSPHGRSTTAPPNSARPGAAWSPQRRSFGVAVLRRLEVR